MTTAGTPPTVLHRLALAVDCLDALSGRRVATAVRIGREVPVRARPGGGDPAWPCLSLPGRGTGRAVALLDAPAPTSMRLRIADPARRFVARRFDVPLWTLPEVVAAEATPAPVAALSRSIRPWLLPGSAAALPRATTAVRGRVVRAGVAVRWARVDAKGPGGVPVGWAHADERGEFVLVITGTGTLPPPAPSELTVRLTVSAMDPMLAPPVDDADPYADLVVEAVARPLSPPGPNDLDNPLLRGRALPAGYVVSTSVPTTVVVPVGAELVLTDDIPFTT